MGDAPVADRSERYGTRLRRTSMRTCQPGRSANRVGRDGRTRWAMSGEPSTVEWVPMTESMPRVTHRLFSVCGVGFAAMTIVVIAVGRWIPAALLLGIFIGISAGGCVAASLLPSEVG